MCSKQNPVGTHITSSVRNTANAVVKQKHEDAQTHLVSTSHHTLGSTATIILFDDRCWLDATETSVHQMRMVYEDCNVCDWRMSIVDHEIEACVASSTIQWQRSKWIHCTKITGCSHTHEEQKATFSTRTHNLDAWLSFWTHAHTVWVTLTINLRRHTIQGCTIWSTRACTGLTKCSTKISTFPFRDRISQTVIVVDLHCVLWYRSKGWHLNCWSKLCLDHFCDDLLYNLSCTKYTLIVVYVCDHCSRNHSGITLPF